MDFQPMSPEEMQRMMQFILNQQAQFDTDMEKLSAKTDLIADGLVGLTASVGQVVAAQLRTDEQLRETSAGLREADARLTTHIEQVDSHLNVVIDMFERPARRSARRRKH